MSARDDDALGLILLGGGATAVGALAWRAKRSASAPAADTASTASGAAWIHPAPTLGERPAVVSNPFRARASSDGKAREHLGVDLMYRRKDTRDLVALFPAGTPGGSALFFMPDGIPALAASAGVVTFARMTGIGNTVILRHPSGWTTYYTHLAALAVQPGVSVVAGQPLGTIGASPADPAHLRHLHFELWNDATRAGAVDPDLFLTAWPRVTAAWSPTLVASAAPPLRNGALSAYRTVGDRGEPYPDWVRALKGEAGVYVIRDADTHEVLYVGSSSGRLYDTLTRHFQTWRRWKDFWKGQYSEGADPGLTYRRAAVEVAVRLTAPSESLDEEMRLIARLRPRDNQIGQPNTATDESIPF